MSSPPISPPPPDWLLSILAAFPWIWDYANFNTIGASGNKNALIYGLWSELIVGYWSSVDILLNRYHHDVASKGGALLHAFLDCDVAVRHPKAFVYAEI